VGHPVCRAERVRPTFPAVPQEAAAGFGQERTYREDTVEPGRRPLLVLVGGVPGAGKSTLLARVGDDEPGAVVLDPDAYRRWFRTALPRAPYRAYRPVVHTLHAAAVAVAVLRGPAGAGGVLLVHDPATRPRRRRALARLARARGWEPVLVVVDVPRTAALDGQLERGRVVAAGSFAGHWRRWQEQRARLADGARAEGWAEVHVVDRRTAAPTLRGVLVAPSPVNERGRARDAECSRT
jgi:predicted kinase